MNFLYHWVLSWSIALYVAIALAGAGMVLGRFLPDLSPYRMLAKWGGRVMLVIAIYLAGYQSADDYADHQRQLLAERAKTQLAEFQRNSALRDLAAQKIAAEAARAERDALAATRSELQQKVAEYEEAERSAPAPKCSCDGAVINNRDVRWRRGLQPRK